MPSMHDKAYIIEKKIQGASQRAIAKDLGVHQSTISRALADDQCKELLDQAQRRYVAALPQVAERFLALCLDEDKSISTANLKELHKIVGIAPSHTQSVFIQQIYNDNRQMLSEETSAILERLAGPAAIDAEYEALEDI